MSDTKITPDERARWLSEAQPKNIDYYEPIDFELDKRIRNLIGALEQAESRAEKSEAGNARLTKELDWLANKLIYCPPKFTNCAVDCAECRKEAARRAVAAGEE